jgi:AcrR family transcriptional regulator
VGRPSLAATRRPQILRAFEDCVLKYGLEGTSLERVAAEVGVRRGLIRHYFGNRAELTQALMDGVIDRTIESYRDIVARAGAAGGTEALIDYLTGPKFPDRRDDALIDALMAVSHRDPALRGQLRGRHQGCQRSISRELRRAFPVAPSREVRGAAYALMCLAFANAAMYDIELPARRHGDAGWAARQIVARLRDSADSVA